MELILIYIVKQIVQIYTMEHEVLVHMAVMPLIMMLAVLVVVLSEMLGMFEKLLFILLEKFIYIEVFHVCLPTSERTWIGALRSFIIFLTLLLVGQGFIGFENFYKLILGPLIFVFIRMIFLCKLPEGLVNLLLSRFLIYTQYLVVILL